MRQLSGPQGLREFTLVVSFAIEHIDISQEAINDLAENIFAALETKGYSIVIEDRESPL